MKSFTLLSLALLFSAGFSHVCASGSPQAQSLQKIINDTKSGRNPAAVFKTTVLSTFLLKHASGTVPLSIVDSQLKSLFDKHNITTKDRKAVLATFPENLHAVQTNRELTSALRTKTTIIITGCSLKPNSLHQFTAEHSAQFAEAAAVTIWHAL